MGRDKALLSWGDTDLLGHTLRRLGAACAEIPNRGLGMTSAETAVLSGPSPRFADHGVPVYPDVVVDAGPVGGILTGLASLKADLGLFLAVDLPLIPISLLQHLLSLAPGHDAVVPISPNGPEPLCAVYTRACEAPIRGRIDRGELKMTAFWPDVRVRRVDVPELRTFGDPETLFLNLNSAVDYERARALAGTVA
jgi:molybdopterin-guanine dinucleotide biosynthesis protein A